MRNRRRLWLTLLLSLALSFGLLTWVVIAGYTPQLGLDLAGGTSVVLTAKGETSTDSLAEAVDIIRSRVDDLGVAEPEIITEGNENIVVQLPGLENEDQALDLIGTTAELGFRRVEAVFPAPQAVPEESGGTTETTVPPAEGEGEPSTSTPPTDTTSPEGGGQSSGSPDAGSSIFRAASLQAQAPETTPPTGTTEIPVTPDGQVPTQTQVPVQAPPLTPPDQIKPDVSIVVPDRDGTLIYQLGPEVLSGREVENAQAQIQSGVGASWIVTLQFSGKGDDAYQRITGEAACAQIGDPTRQIAIVLDNEVVSAPQVAEDVQCNQGISGGGIITLGDAENQQEEAEDLARKLRYGSLPIELETSSIETVSPTLGQDSLDAGMVAAIVGLVLVAIYVLVLYRLFGLYIVFGLAMFGVLVYVFVALMSEFYGLTLTLAGLAAIVVSIGINADSAIVIIERIKDEVQEGRTIRTSTERGYTRAFRTIVAGDMVSILAAATLYFLTVGSVRGFALMLGVSTLLDLLITIFIMRPMVLLSGDSWPFRNERLLFWHRPVREPSGERDASLEAAT